MVVLLGITAPSSELVRGGTAESIPGSSLLASSRSALEQAAAPSDIATNLLRSFSATGLVREVPAGGDKVVVAHDAIPGLMPKMTMEFTLRDPSELLGLRPGDRISFQVKADEEQSWIEGIRRDLSPALPPVALTKPLAALAHIAQLKPGDLLPDAEVLSEQGRILRLSDFRGSALAFTFIFTRCPLPDFCPRMSQRFRQARELLLHQPASPTNWQFLCLSFDPDFDRPEVLSAYAVNYRGPNLDRWLFASAATNVTAAMASQLDFRFADNAGSFVHNLRTVVLDTQGRLYRQFDGNAWSAEALAQAIVHAAQQPLPSPNPTWPLPPTLPDPH